MTSVRESLPDELDHTGNSEVNNAAFIDFYYCMELCYFSEAHISSQDATAFYRQQRDIQASASQIEQMISDMQHSTSGNDMLKTGHIPRDLSVSVRLCFLEWSSIQFHKLLYMMPTQHC